MEISSNLLNVRRILRSSSISERILRFYCYIYNQGNFQWLNRLDTQCRYSPQRRNKETHHKYTLDTCQCCGNREVARCFFKLIFIDVLTIFSQFLERIFQFWSIFTYSQGKRGIDWSLLHKFHSLCKHNYVLYAMQMNLKDIVDSKFHRRTFHFCMNNSGMFPLDSDNAHMDRYLLVFLLSKVRGKRFFEFFFLRLNDLNPIQIRAMHRLYHTP